MSELRELCAQLRDVLRSSDPALSAGDVCADIAEDLAATEKVVAAARVRHAVRAVACGEHRKRGYAGPAEWVSRSAGSSVGEARADLATTVALDDCPDTAEAVNAGELSLAQAAEVLRVPGCEHELLAFARTHGLRSLREKARRRHLERVDPDELHAEQHRQRGVHHRRDELKMVRGTFAFPPAFGVRFANRLDAETDRVWREARRAGLSPTRAQCAADAFERLFEGKGAGAGRTDLVLVYDLDAFARGHAHAGEVAQILGGGPLPVAIARRLAVDAFVKVVLHHGTKVDTVIHYGRRRPTLLQTILDLGEPPDFDGVACADEGCDRRFGLQWDHVDPAAHDGPVSFANLQPLCYPHHREKTERDRVAGLLNGNANGTRTRTREERGPP